MAERIVVYTGTRNVYTNIEVAAKSLLCNTQVDRVFFCIEDDTFPSQLPDIVTVKNIPANDRFDPDGPNYRSSWTYMAFLRLAFPKVFAEYDQVLYLDSDTLVLQDISDILSMNLGRYYFAMAQEDIGDIPLEILHSFADTPNGLMKCQSDNPRPEFCVRPYYNSGVLLMNLRELRRTGKDDELIQEINTVRHQYPDQDAINLLCHGSILPLPAECNVIPALFPDFPQENIRIKHFASDKPLWKSSLWQYYKRMPWDKVMENQNKLKGGT